MAHNVFPNLDAILSHKTFYKIEHEEIDTSSKIEISQDADNADQKVKLSVLPVKLYFLEISPVHQNLWSFKCTMLKILNSNFLQ